MKKVFSCFFAFAVLALMASCKNPESNYVTVTFKHFKGDPLMAVVLEQPVVVLRGNVMDPNTAKAVVESAFAVDGYEVKKFFVASESFDEKSDYRMPSEMPIDAKMFRVIDAENLRYATFPENIILYAYYSPVRQNGG